MKLKLLKKLKVFSSIFILIILSSGCVIYPHTIDVPLIKEKNDLRVDAGISRALDATATVSYGLTEKIAVQGFGSYGADDKHYVQGAVGYFRNTGNNIILEWYSGFGYGYGDAYNNAKPGNLFGNYWLGFTQFNFGKVNTRFANTDYGIGLKTGYLLTNLTDRNYYDIYYVDDLLKNYTYPAIKDNGILFHPMLFTRLGGEKLKFNLKAGTIWIYKFTNRDKKLPTAHFNIGLSLNYSINTR